MGTPDLSEDSARSRAQECRGLAEILRDLAAQLRFAESRKQLIALADRLDVQVAELDPSTLAETEIGLPGINGTALRGQ